MATAVRDILVRYKTLTDQESDEKIEKEQREILRTELAFKLQEIPGYAIPEEKAQEILLLGKASAYSNNCAFHCLAEILFHLPDEKLDLVKEFDGFKLICDTFSEYYKDCGIPQPIDLTFIKSFNAEISHPYDFQLIWGPVLRLAFCKHLLQNLPDYTTHRYYSYIEKTGPLIVNEGQTIEMLDLNQFISTFGGTLTVTKYVVDDGTTTTEFSDPSLAAGDRLPPCWELNLRLKIPAGKQDGHYEFEVRDERLKEQSERNGMLIEVNARLVPTNDNASRLQKDCIAKNKEPFDDIVGEDVRKKILTGVVQTLIGKSLKAQQPSFFGQLLSGLSDLWSRFVEVCRGIWAFFTGKTEVAPEEASTPGNAKGDSNESIAHINNSDVSGRAKIINDTKVVTHQLDLTKNPAQASADISVPGTNPHPKTICKGNSI